MARSERHRRSIGKFLEYAFMRMVFFPLILMPFRLRAAVLEWLCIWLGRLSRNARERVLGNIRAAFPDRSDAWHRSIATQNFRNLGRLAAEFLHDPYIDDKFHDKWFVLKPDPETHRRAWERGGILVLGHLGDWEWKGVSITRNGPNPLYVLAKRQSNPWSNDYIARTRGSQNIKLIYTDESPRVIFKLLKEKALIGFIADQDAGPGGPFIPFLNRLASTFQGPALFARKTTAPIYFLWSYHDEERRLVFELREMPRPDCDPADAAEWERQFTMAWVSLLDEKVREHPEDYFWIHRRWRSQPDDPESVWKFWREWREKRGEKKQPAPTPARPS
jgi:KDO2-lipid IV(A) lauroyltransferase